jgi:transposase-like protein
MRGFKWTDKSRAVALSLAEGKTKDETAKAIGIGEAIIFGG